MDEQITVVVTIGIPASGKSTFAARFACRNDLKIISTDDIRFEKFGLVFNMYTRQGVHDEMMRQAKIAAKSGIGFVIDTTLFNQLSERTEALKELRSFDVPMRITAAVFDVPLEECLRRNALRSGTARVPDEMIGYHLDELDIPSFSERLIDEIVQGVDYENQ